MVIVGAYAAVTGLVGLDALLGAMRESVPAYRTPAHRARNEAALRVGAEALAAARACPAWDDELARP